MEQYLSLGRSFIFTDKIRPIKNNGNKPNGGIWATVHNPEYKNFNLWIEYMSINPHILFYKHNSFNIPAVFITLSENCNILKIEDLDTLYKTIDNNDWIDFEELAKKYDGVYISLNKIISECQDMEIVKKLMSYGVSSLIIFNTNCISYYQKANVSIKPFDYEYEPSFSDYTIEIDEEKNLVMSCEDTINKYLTKLYEYISLLKTIDYNSTIYQDIKRSILEIIYILQNTLKYDNEEIMILKKVFNQS